MPSFVESSREKSFFFISHQPRLFASATGCIVPTVSWSFLHQNRQPSLGEKREGAQLLFIVTDDDAVESSLARLEKKNCGSVVERGKSRIPFTSQEPWLLFSLILGLTFIN